LQFQLYILITILQNILNQTHDVTKKFDVICTTSIQNVTHFW